MRKLVKVIRIGILWTQAEQAAANDDYERAMSILNSIYKLLEVTIPSKRATYGINLLCGLVSAKTNNYRLGADATRIALQQIEEDRGLSNYEKDYLKYYAKHIIIVYIGHRSKDANLSREGMGISVTFAALERDRVRTRIRRKFPVKGPDE
jgi:hypothetical protein